MQRVALHCSVVEWHCHCVCNCHCAGITSPLRGHRIESDCAAGGVPLLCCSIALRLQGVSAPLQLHVPQCIAVPSCYDCITIALPPHRDALSLQCNQWQRIAWHCIVVAVYCRCSVLAIALCEECRRTAIALHRNCIAQSAIGTAWHCSGGAHVLQLHPHCAVLPSCCS